MIVYQLSWTEDQEVPFTDVEEAKAAGLAYFKKYRSDHAGPLGIKADPPANRVAWHQADEYWYLVDTQTGKYTRLSIWPCTVYETADEFVRTWV